SSRRRHTRSKRDWSSDVCSSDLISPHLSPACQQTLGYIICAIHFKNWEIWITFIPPFICVRYCLLSIIIVSHYSASLSCYLYAQEGLFRNCPNILSYSRKT